MQHNEHIEQLDHHLSQVKHLLKPSPIGLKKFSCLWSKNYLYEKTWTLVIGTAHSGKTAFLQQAELNVIQGISEDNTGCNTWFSQEGVFIELPSLSLGNIEVGNIENTLLLQDFLQTIKTRRHKRPFDNILLTINLMAFMHEYDQYIQYLEALKEQLQKILNPFITQEVGIYIVFTHMDRIAGFCDFFSEFSTQQQTQALGYLLEDYSSKKKLIEQHEKKYDRLLSRLHENLITLLHKTRNNLTRYLIREFPQQLESLRNMIRSSLSSTADINESTLKVKGLFFTSACQSGLCIDRITLPISQSYQLTLPTHFPQAYRAQPYFIKGAIKMIVKDNIPRDMRFARYRQEHKRLAYLSSAGVAFLFCVMGWGYFSSIKHLDNATSTLNDYQMFAQKFTQDNTFSALLPELQYLATAHHSLDEVKPLFIPLKALNKAKHWVNAQYYQTLSEQFLPQLAHRLEEELLHETNPAQQYAALKAYLMLGEPQYLQLNYLRTWIFHNLHLSSSKALKSSLLQPFPSIALNTQIIEQVRNNLNTLPSDYLAYMIIKNSHTKFVPYTNEAFIFPSSSQKGIPSFYMRTEFEKHYHQTIAHAIQRLAQENWILKNSSFSAKDSKELIQKSQNLYIADYLNWWRLFIYHVQPKPLNNLDEAATYFNSLVQPKISPLVNMLTFIQSNTRPFQSEKSSTLQVFNTQIASQLDFINTISAESLQSINPLLNNLSHYFSVAVTSPNREAFAFNTAKQKFTHPTQSGTLDQLRTLAQNMPAPINQWIEQMASNSWFLVLSEAKNMLTQQWQKQVFPEYTQNITNRFPLNALAEQEISLENFSHFFGTGGVLQTFFEEYLKPFLDTSQAQWNIKKIDHLGLPLRPDIILQFERANVIHEMFFPLNAATPSIHFALQSTELQPIVSHITFNINGQTLAASQTEKNTQSFTWPGDYTHVPVTLSIQNISGENFEATEYGAWGLFRLLSHANVFPIGNDTRKLQIIFDINGNAAQYLLQATNPVNPFIPNILQSFQLSQDLF